MEHVHEAELPSHRELSRAHAAVVQARHLLPPHEPAQALLHERARARGRQLARARLRAKEDAVAIEQHARRELHVLRVERRVEAVAAQHVGAPQGVRAAKVARPCENLHRGEKGKVRDEELGVHQVRQKAGRPPNVRRALHGVRAGALNLREQQRERVGVGPVVGVVQRDEFVADEIERGVEIGRLGGAALRLDHTHAAARRPRSLGELGQSRLCRVRARRVVHQEDGHRPAVLDATDDVLDRRFGDGVVARQIARDYDGHWHRRDRRDVRLSARPRQHHNAPEGCERHQTVEDCGDG